MVHIGYFSLLLLFISANIIDGMDITTFETKKLEARKEELAKLPSPYIPGLELDYQQGDPGTDKFFKSKLGLHTLQSKLYNQPQLHPPNIPFGQQIGKPSNSNFSSSHKNPNCLFADWMEKESRTQVPSGSFTEFQRPATENFATKSPVTLRKSSIDTEPSDPFKKTDTFQQTSSPSRQQTEEQQNSKIKINSDHSIETTSKIEKFLTTTTSKKETLRIKTGYRITMSSPFGQKLVSLSHKNPDYPIVTVTEKKFYATTQSGSMTKFIDKHTQPQQSIPQSLLAMALRSLNKTESPMSTDDECSTVDDQEPLTLEQLFPKQSPRKKRRVDTKNLPANAYFTIICPCCSKKFKSYNKAYLINYFKKHLNDIAENEIKSYTNEHFQEAKRIVKFSVNCPVPGCEYTVRVTAKHNLQGALLHHIFKIKKHLYEKKKHSKESIKNHVNENFESKLIPNPNFFKC